MRVKPFSYLEQKDTGVAPTPPQPAQVNQTGLIGWYDANFPGSSPTTVWENLTGNTTFDLTPVNSPSYVSTTDAAYYEISAAGNSHFETNWYFSQFPVFSIQIFTYPTVDVTSSGLARFFGHLNTTSSTVRTFFGMNNGRLDFSIGDFFSPGYNIDTTNPAYLPTLNTWREFAVTIDSSGNITGYTDNTVWDTGTWDQSPGFPAPNNPWYWGQQFNGNENYSGRFSVILVYDRELTSTELQNNITAINSRYNY